MILDRNGGDDSRKECIAGRSSEGQTGWAGKAELENWQASILLGLLCRPHGYIFYCFCSKLLDIWWLKHYKFIILKTLYVYISYQTGLCCCCCLIDVKSNSCDLMDYSPPGSSVPGISQQEYWSGLSLPSPGHLPDPGIKSESPTLAGRFFTIESPGKPPYRPEVKWSEVKSLSSVQLFVTPWITAYQAPPSMGFSRQEYWSGLPFPSPGLRRLKSGGCWNLLSLEAPWFF